MKSILQIKNRLTTIFLLTFLSSISFSQIDTNRTVGLILKNSSSSLGYTLFNPMASKKTFLINSDGLLINSWESNYYPGVATYLFDDGSLLRAGKIGNPIFTAGGNGGIFEIFDWDGNITWSYKYSSEKYCQHHDMKILPNGNILFIAWELKSDSLAIENGRNPELLKQNALWPDYLVEVKPTGDTTGNIVWEWHVWDYLIQDFDSTKENYGNVKEHPELIDLNYIFVGDHDGNADWNHFNGIDYNEKLDQIIVSVHSFSEVWILDHSTTTEEAKSSVGGKYGKGGDILYRWGNPIVYRRGSAKDQKLFSQHDTQWIKPGLNGEGNLLVFNNGRERGYSSVDEFVTPVDSNGFYSLQNGLSFGPKELQWSYQKADSTSFFSAIISSAQRMENGNTLINEGLKGTFFEVTPQKKIVWKYINPVGKDGAIIQGDSTNGKRISVFKIHHYTDNFSGFVGKDLTPGAPLEFYPNNVANNNDNKLLSYSLSQNYPNPFNPTTTIKYRISSNANRESIHVKLVVYNLLGEKIATLVNQYQKSGNYQVTFNASLKSGISLGIYFYKISAGDFTEIKKMMLIK